MPDGVLPQQLFHLLSSVNNFLLRAPIWQHSCPVLRKLCICSAGCAVNAYFLKSSRQRKASLNDLLALAELRCQDWPHQCTGCCKSSYNSLQDHFTSDFDIGLLRRLSKLMRRICRHAMLALFMRLISRMQWKNLPCKQRVQSKIPGGQGLSRYEFCSLFFTSLLGLPKCAEVWDSLDTLEKYFFMQCRKTTGDR